jgi:hypothetical protein
LYGARRQLVGEGSGNDDDEETGRMFARGRAAS